MPRAATRTTLVIGGNGFLGSLVAASLLTEERSSLLLPIRNLARADDCLSRVRAALLDRGVSRVVADDLMTQARVTALPPPGAMKELDTLASSMRVDEIVHCAGCLDYFDTARLQQANIELTCHLLDAARRWKVDRFIYLSTAYCSGYLSGVVPEKLHGEPPACNEPTDYTRTKRAAEWRIADSNVPFIIVRPSIVIGDSRNGTYRGRNYGLYQMWRAWESLLGPQYLPLWYTVAPRVRLNFVHQDCFASGFLAIYRSAKPGTIAHVVSAHESSPTMRDICWLWADVYCPKEIRCYASIDDVPFDSLPARQRRFLQIVAKNLEIAAHPWRFESPFLDALRAGGTPFTDATVESVAVCQRLYVAGSEKILAHRRLHAGCYDGEPKFVELDHHATAHGVEQQTRPRDRVPTYTQ